MNRDIRDRSDIIALVDRFYEKVKTDAVIGYFFTEVARINWPEHLAVMYDFWDNALFFSGGYEGNPMQVHKDLHSKSPMTMQHFQRWNQLFSETVDELYAGTKAELIKQRALSIAMVIQIHLFK